MLELAQIVIRYRYRILAVYALCLAMSTITIQTGPGSMGFEMAWRCFSVPIVLFVFGLLYYGKEDFAELMDSSVIPWVHGLLIYCPGLLLIGWRFLLIVNAIHHAPQPLVYEGPEIQKYYGDRSDPYRIRLQNRATDEPVTLSVYRSTFDATNVGDRYCESYYKGILGISYRWTFARNLALVGACNPRDPARAG